MRSKAQRKILLRNRLAGAALSLVFAGAVSLFLHAFYAPGPVIMSVIFIAAFAVMFSLMFILWKKTDFPRKVMYLLHCIKHPGKSRKYYCPCCNRSLAFFTDMRYCDDPERFDPERFKKNRQDVICPFCYSAPRQRILASWADNNTDLLRKSKILYFAPEYSMSMWFKRNGIRPQTADLYDPGADLRIDITDTGLPGGSYDMVICNHVLEHVPDYSKALNELNRILTPGGKLIINFPINPELDTVLEKPADTPEERIRLYGQHDHIRLFGRDSAELIGRYGFTISDIDLSQMPKSILPVTGPADYDSNRIFCCIKQSSGE